jgi:hypothetical protein
MGDSLGDPVNTKPVSPEVEGWDGRSHPSHAGCIAWACRPIALCCQQNHRLERGDMDLTHEFEALALRTKTTVALGRVAFVNSFTKTGVIAR